MNRARFQSAWTSSAIAFLAMLPAARAQTYQVAGGTFVSKASPSAGFGALGLLNVGSGATALVQIDLSRLTALGVTSGQIQQATMVVYVNNVITAGGIDVALVTSPWSETSVTYNTQPTAGAPFLSNIPTPAQGNYLAFDIGEHARD